MVRADDNTIKIAAGTNIQDRAVISTGDDILDGPEGSCKIGENCTIGHGALITSATIGDRVLIGQGAVVNQGCVVGNDSLIAAGSVLIPGCEVGAGQLWSGNPAAYQRDLTAEEIKGLGDSAASYSALSKEHDKEFEPFKEDYEAAELEK